MYMDLTITQKYAIDAPTASVFMSTWLFLPGGSRIGSIFLNLQDYELRETYLHCLCCMMLLPIRVSNTFASTKPL